MSLHVHRQKQVFKKASSVGHGGAFQLRAPRRGLPPKAAVVTKKPWYLS